jgi:hypothetical protein
MKYTLALLSAVIGLAMSQVQAASITGTLQLGGAVRFDTNSLATATTVNIWFDDQAHPGHSTVQDGNTGDFTSIASGTQADMHNGWVFNPSTPTPALWSVGGFTFDLLSSTIVVQNSSVLAITGTGTVSGNGFDATSMDWAFTTQSAGGINHLIFSFSANGTAVPDGGTTIMLLGSGLTALGIARRFFG